MKIAIFLTLVLCSLVTSEFITLQTSIDIIKPSPKDAYKSEEVIKIARKDESVDFFPYLDDFVTYSGWYRKIDKSMTEEENLKAQIDDLKIKLFNNKNVDTKKLVENREVYDERWLNKQLKIARILELEDLLNASEESNKNK